MKGAWRSVYHFLSEKRRVRWEHVDHAPAIDAAIAQLSEPQRRAWHALMVDRLVRLLCGRQAGKTYLIALWLLVGALLVAGSVNVYLALTKESAKRAIWPELLTVGAVLGIDPSCFKLHGGVVTLPNGSTVLVMGTDDKATIETWRGSKLNRVAIDEMGSQPPEWIAYMVREIVWWCIMRHDGAIALLGTPGLVPDGYWWEQSRPDAKHDVHHWTVFDNPGIPHAREFVADTLRENEWTEATPQYRREVLGEWNDDASAVVYPFADERNGADALPALGAGDVIIPAKAWSHVVAVSVASPETIAVAVWAWHRAVAGAFAVEAFNEAADPETGLARVSDTLTRYPGSRCIVDPGELGEEHVLTLRRRWRLPAGHAAKADKPSAIRELRGAVLSGSARYLRGDATQALRDEWRVTAWHPKKWGVAHDPARRNLLASAAAFGWRRVPARTPPKDMRPGTPDWQAQLIARTEADVRRTARRRSTAIGRLDR